MDLAEFLLIGLRLSISGKNNDVGDGAPSPSLAGDSGQVCFQSWAQGLSTRGADDVKLQSERQLAGSPS